jgi:hypothetical protein
VSQNIFNCLDVPSLAIGSPDEDLGRVRNAGSVTLVAIRKSSENPKPCPSEQLTQGHGLPGTAEAGDRLGAAVSTIGGADHEQASFDTLLVGSPGEDVGTHHDTGRAAIAEPIKRFVKGFGAQSGDRTNRSYGAVFGTEADGL